MDLASRIEVRHACLLCAGLILLACATPLPAAPTVGETTVLGPFVGHDAQFHPDNLLPQRIEFYGTDLGFSYEHAGQLHFLFGDSWAIEAYAPIQQSTGGRYDDAFGSIDRRNYPNLARITRRSIPPVRLGQNAGTAQASAIDPGHVMDLGKTPLAGFSNGRREFAIFNLTKPQGCRVDSDCGGGLSCDTGLGYLGNPYTKEEGLTLACMDEDSGCQADTMASAAGSPVSGSGFCVDPASTIWADTAAGRISAAAIQQRVALRSLTDPRQYTDAQRWLTNKFVNVIARTVREFRPSTRGERMRVDYRSASQAGGEQRVFLWGRPGFVGVGAQHRSLGVYFAYADMPAGAGFSWNLHYFTGTSASGVPHFSRNEADAVPLDLDATLPGIQPAEAHDIVNQMSVAWVEPLKKWLMLYGGGLSELPSSVLPRCGVVELFAGRACKDVVMGTRAVRMRTADHPWGPWSPPQDVIAGGDPAVAGSGQYGVGGVLHHPACQETGCATHSQTSFYHADEYGFLYGVNIIDPWIHRTGAGVEVIWNASTWDPYRVVLLKTRINR